jgi:hypothetical protein
VAIENRRFLQRAVRFLAASGISRFLDGGTRLPTQGNVHEVAQAVNPAVRVRARGLLDFTQPVAVLLVAVRISSVIMTSRGVRVGAAGRGAGVQLAGGLARDWGLPRGRSVALGGRVPAGNPSWLR